MAVSNIFKCNICGYKVVTSGHHESYRDGHGNRRPYGHPSPTSFEALVYGIKGFSARKYCFNCDQVKDIIVSELEKPAEYWNDFQNIPCKTFDPACEECNGNLYSELTGLICPRCNEGIFESELTGFS